MSTLVPTVASQVANGAGGAKMNVTGPVKQAFPLDSPRFCGTSTSASGNSSPDTKAGTAAQCGASNDEATSTEGSDIPPLEPVPSFSPPDVPASSVGLGASQAPAAPSDRWSLPPPVPGATFWPDAYLCGFKTGENQEKHVELKNMMQMVAVWSERYKTNSPTCACDAARSADYQRGFQIGCQTRKAFLSAMVMSELTYLLDRMRRHMLVFM